MYCARIASISSALRQSKPLLAQMSRMAKAVVEGLRHGADRYLLEDRERPQRLPLGGQAPRGGHARLALGL
eukprot:894644-Pyramimonas_sp.AAC.1